MKRIIGWHIAMIAIAALLLTFANQVQALTTEETFEFLPDAGDKCPIGNDYYFVYSFDKKPQLGTIILKVVLYNKAGQQDAGLKIIGESGMPSMKGHHDSGEVEFKLNKKGDYLLPVNIVMPGEWEIRLKFLKGDQVLYRGRTLFDI